MGQLEMWKLATDLLLVGALGVLCYRMLRGQAGITGMSREVRHLESTLRELVREADIASQGLNDKLSRRQQTLEKLLDELTASEREVRRTISRAETQADERSARERLMVRESVKDAPPAPKAAPMVARPAAPQRIETRDEAEEQVQVALQGEPVRAPSAPAFVRSAPVAAPSAPGAAVARWQAANNSTPPNAASGAQDISGATRRLAEEIEREVVPTRPSARAAQAPVVPPSTTPARESEVAPAPGLSAAIEDVYERAEQLIKAGKDLALVQQTTKLPMNEIRILSQVVLRETTHVAAPTATPVVIDPISAEPRAIEAQETDVEMVGNEVVRSADPRLGVLSPIRRQVQTL